MLLEDMGVIFRFYYPLKFLTKGCNMHVDKMRFSDKSPNLLLCTSKGTETHNSSTLHAKKPWTTLMNFLEKLNL